eukprot:symbB.v1.2.002580.t1/scaffold137.1/size303853/11
MPSTASKKGGTEETKGAEKAKTAEATPSTASKTEGVKDTKGGEIHESDGYKGKGKGKGSIGAEDMPKGKGKGKGKSHHRHHRHHRHHHRHRRGSRGRGSHSRHRSHRRSHRSHSASKRMKHLLQRQRLLRSHSPRTRSRSISPWRYGQPVRLNDFPSKSVASLRRSVGLLQTEGLAALPDMAPRRAKACKKSRLEITCIDLATAFLFNIGRDADEANKIDQETDQQEIQEEAKTIVNAESAGYDQPTGIEEGEEEEFEHEMQEPVPQVEQPQGPGCQCPGWDPLKTALPEDKQHASLVMLQRRIRPENQVAPSLREAASAVERAGRLFEGWVRRRQQLADVLPELAVKMESCHNRAKDFAKSAAEQALQSLKDRLEEEEDAEADAEEQAEMAEGQNRFEAVEEAQEDFNEMAQQQEPMLGAHAPAWGAQGAQHAPAKTQAHAFDQSAFVGTSTKTGPKVAFQAGEQQLAQAMGQIYGHGGHGPPAIQGEMRGEVGEVPTETPEDAVMDAPQQLEVEEEIQEDADLEQAKEVQDWGDFFRECGEFRIPPTAFDRAMQVAEKKVGRAIQHSLIRGA